MTPSPAILENHPLAPLTTLGLGGPARYFAMCASTDECRAAIEFGRVRRLPIHVLGGGSNTIFLDEGYPGIVIQVFISGITVTTVQGGVELQVGAGEQWDDVVTSAIAKGLGIIRGDQSGNCNPNDIATRTQAAIMLYNCMSRK